MGQSEARAPQVLVLFDPHSFLKGFGKRANLCANWSSDQLSVLD